MYCLFCVVGRFGKGWNVYDRCMCYLLLIVVGSWIYFVYVEFDRGGFVDEVCRVVYYVVKNMLIRL